MTRRKMLPVVLTLVGLYALATLLVTLGQRRMIYHPSHFAPGLLDQAAAPLGLRRWNNSAGKAIGWWRPSKLGPAQARVLIVHGNAGSALDRVDYADGLQASEAADVFILEYPGYGDRPGAPSQTVGSSRVDLQACKLEYSIVSPK